MLLSKKYPLVKQYDQIDCAPAALLTILKYYGGRDNLVHVRELCNTTATGSSMLGMANAARKLGFRANGKTGTYEDLLKEQMPCIAHVINENGLQHFIVVYKVEENRVLIADPGTGIRKISKMEFQSWWKQKYVLVLEPKEKIFRGENPHWYMWILGYLKQEKIWIYQSLFLGLVYTGLSLLFSYFIHLLIDRFIPSGDLSKITYAAVILFFILTIRTVASFIRHRFSVELNEKVSLSINTNFITHLFKLPKRFFDTRKTGDITARIHDTIRIQQAILQITGHAVIDILVIVGSIVFIFFFSREFGLTALCAVPLYSLILWLHSRKIKSEQREVVNKYAIVEATYIDSLSGIDEIMSFNSSNAFVQLNRFTFNNYQRKIKQLGFTKAKLGLFAEFTGAIFTLFVLFMGTLLVINKTLLLGEMMASYSLAAAVLSPVNRLTETNITLMGASVAGQRLLDLLLVKKESDDEKLPFKFHDSMLIKTGYFTWPGEGELFNNLNIEIKKGNITALLGKSGSGKSTLVNLIQRKYEFDSVDYLIDGLPANKICLGDLRNNIGVVPQEIKIFGGTLAENILCGRIPITINELTKTVEALGLVHFISDFPQGYATIIGEGRRRLSGGEKQILGLLRALYNSPALLIIDEGLCSVDHSTQLLLFKIITEYARNQAVLLISHHPGAVCKADYLYILHDKMIAEQGSPSELIRKRGLFYSTWADQRNTITIQTD